MTVSIIVTTYNRPDALKMVLDALLVQTRLPDQVLIADDGSDGTTADILKNYLNLANIGVAHVWQEDRGFRAAKIRNAAIRQATGRYVVFLDGDCIPNRHFVKDHLRLARTGFFFQGKRVLVKKRAVGAFGWQETNSKGKLLKRMLSGDLGNVHHLLRCPWYPATRSAGLAGTRSCNLGIFRADLLAVNGFNEAFHGWGREDSELVVRLYRYGLQRRAHPFMAICFHLWHAENSREGLSRNDQILRKTIDDHDYFTPRGVVQRS